MDCMMGAWKLFRLPLASRIGESSGISNSTSTTSPATRVSVDHRKAFFSTAETVSMSSEASASSSTGVVRFRRGSIIQSVMAQPSATIRSDEIAVK